MTLALDAPPREVRNTVVRLATSLGLFGKGVFFAHYAANQTIATATTLQLVASTEIVDKDSWFASNVFTPLQAGYYLLFGSVYVANDVDWDSGKYLKLFIRKNGATPTYIARSGEVSSTVNATASGSVQIIVILEANGTTDYFDLAASHDDNSTITVSDVTFGGFYIAGV